MDPIIRRRQVGEKLRRLREAAGKSQADVMAAMEWSKSKVNRIETGSVGVGKSDLVALLRFYAVADADEIEALVTDSRAARRHSGWGEYRHLVSPEFYAFVAYEESALAIRSFQPLAVPGLLQTDDYAAAVTGWRARHDRVTVDALVKLRMRRQELLERSDGPAFFFLLSEAAISYHIGENGVMRGQLKRLMTHAQEPNVTLRIVPFSAGLHPRWRDPYVVLEVGDRGSRTLEDLVLYIEDPRGELVISERAAANTTLRPSVWLDDHRDLEERAGDLDATMATLEAALARLPRS
ncbi:helix-turn-helix domain-containing protein [Cryptosporangium aurantiacum]|uniref:Transcriptional regulator, contains XRE-family HTH domain n=1 Tax=Cryptosporangium aurantiacum TaxID=134849 RepID=A0A1M7RKV5_9ACTN|nr:helix-turn-helix transcriptional regulator [Cryptosporangium aurantiacum]SHN46975.1 Transcriptional regulator, contains XRE-family HTH domain [Cryptosporangium aurantiacum]